MTTNPIAPPPQQQQLGAPVAATAMDRGSTFLADRPDIFVKQTMKGCIEELICGCDANVEFKISTMQKQDEDVYYVTEDSNWCVRMLFGAVRPMKIKVSDGAAPGGKLHAVYERPLRLPLNNMKFCCFQTINIQDAEGEPLGAITEDFWFCVPSFKVTTETGALQYNVQPPTCCGGVCIDLFYLGICSCQVPFNVYLPGKTGSGQEVGYVVKRWGGLVAELFTDADKFELRFPEGADPQSKSRLLGATFLLNQIFYEKKVLFFALKNRVEGIFSPVPSPIKLAGRVV